ncbi:hypothetical protein BCR34DRAFT_603462 [Clohesyomyces aquaticus]|uniref:Uncharacterized protein n=1 Tax=Clohesyomyces aquaticus TaxID=1231657 RepID=A0A1Y1ZEK7_9PLEO|nr:hypothetical protein BCR34DRAFT_603462 [Clohesyomyces aquaticus]
MSARILPQKHYRRLVDTVAGNPPEPPRLGPNEVQLFSYYKPGLSASRYAITARQVITTQSTENQKKQILELYNRKVDDDNIVSQVFNVITPQFSLDPKLVNSIYPPHGHQDEGRILPHIVLNDPHFPWERSVDENYKESLDPDFDGYNGNKIDKNGNPTTNKNSMVYRSMVPWVALLVFDPEELRIPSSDEANELGIPSRNFISGGMTDRQESMNVQPASGSFNMTVSEYFQEIPATNRMRFESGTESSEFSRLTESTEDIEVIFPKRELIESLFDDVESYKYFAHVRNVNTLGKVLALADASFAAALMRFRSYIHALSASQTRKELNGVAPKASLLSNVASTINCMAGLEQGNAANPKRVFAVPERRLAPVDLDHPLVSTSYSKKVAQNVGFSASSGEGVYNEFNDPNNPDWAIIHSWISEKLYLSEIPAHILIPDPSFLPEESLRFFFIDDTWMDCLIDGALSIANHLERDDDRTRVEIKRAYNKYLETPVVEGIKPQIPCFGFFLRSEIVQVMPDIRIEVTWNSQDNRQSVCRYIRPDDHSIMCLLDRWPNELEEITLSQPPHQQRFSLGLSANMKDSEHVSIEAITFPLFTQNPQARERLDDETLVPRGQTPQEIPEAWYDSETRLVNASRMAADINRRLQTAPDKLTGAAYVDYVPTSCELAMELNDPSYFFKIHPPEKIEDRQQIRQLWVPAASALGDSPISDPGEERPDFSKPIGPTPPPPKHPPASQKPSSIPQADRNSLSHFVFKDSSLIAADSKTLLETSTPTSCFTLQVWADYKGPPTTYPKENKFDASDYLPTENPFLFDLIFCIRKIPTKARADYKLREILINIPHTGAKKDIEPLLEEDYDGPGARVLANQRFTATLNRTKEYLQVRLIPRSALKHPTMVINDRRTSEISFRFAEANVAPVRNPTFVGIHGRVEREGGLGVVKVEYYERYEVAGTVFSALPVPGKTFLVKRPKVEE